MKTRVKIKQAEIKILQLNEKCNNNNKTMKCWK